MDEVFGGKGNLFNKESRESKHYSINDGKMNGEDKNSFSKGGYEFGKSSRFTNKENNNFYHNNNAMSQAAPHKMLNRVKTFKNLHPGKQIMQSSLDRRNQSIRKPHPL